MQDQKLDNCWMASYAVRVHPHKNEKDFDAVITLLTQYIDKWAQTSSVKDDTVVETRPAKQQKTHAVHGTFKGKIELKKYSREEYEYDSMLIAQWQQLYELWCKAGLLARHSKFIDNID